MSASGGALKDGRRGAPLFALVSGSVLSLAMPGMLGSFGVLLVLPGLMACFALLTASRRPLRDAYLFGLAFMAWFSWSVHHVMFAAYAAIVLVGGLYFVLAALVVHRARRARVLQFAVAIAAAFWLRAVMPEIHYPHGQPAHALFEWPLLLRGGIALGGEPLVNALLAAIAGALVGVWRAWRSAEVPFSQARREVAVILACAVGISVGGIALRSAPAATGKVSVAAIEPGLHPETFLGIASPSEQRARYRQALEVRLLQPTRELLAGDDPPDLVVWPESSIWDQVAEEERLRAGRARFVFPGPWPSGTDSRLMVGAMLARDGERFPGAFLVDPRTGLVLGHHEKLRLVPGGEFLPFASLLPGSIGTAVREAFEDALGTPAGTLRGRPQPLLETAAGVRFGVLLCYDNAFPGPARDLVGQGARFLTVLSNEAWYRGGAELQQLVAQTVCRAQETGVPIVRCTTDGWSLVVDRDGRILDSLPVLPAPTAAARVLRVKLPIAAPADIPFPWLRNIFGPAAALWSALWLLWRAVGRFRPGRRSERREIR